VWTQLGNKLVGTGAIGSTLNQGSSVCLSSDGNTAIVGGNNDNNGAGAVWIFTNSGGGVWKQQGTKLVGTGAIGAASQGISVSLSTDGNTAIVGGNNDNNGLGAVWIYTRSNGVWTQQGSKLAGSGSIGALASQGQSVSLSFDGNTAVIGGPGDNNNAGASWVFTRSAGVWSQQGSKLFGTGAISSTNQGVSVAISADGNTAILGGNIDNEIKAGAGVGAGAAWVYTRSGGAWSQQGSKLIGTGAIGAASQGVSVSLSSDGNTAIVGGNNDNSGTGAVWIFTRSGGVWTQQGSKLAGTGAIGAAYQGISVSLSSDGNNAMVGGNNDNNGTGAVWVYTRSGGVWTQLGSKLVGTGAIGGANQGYSVSLSSDGSTAMVGGNHDNGGKGAVWIYILSGGLWTQQGSKLIGTGAIGTAYQGQSVSLSSDGNTAIEGGLYDNSELGAAWIYTRSGGVWTQQGSKLVSTGSVGAAWQGSSVSLSADGNTAIVGGSGANAVWLYTRSGGVWTQQGNKLVGTGAVYANQGKSVYISSDGNTAIVGGNRDNNSAGAVWIYTASPIITDVGQVEEKPNYLTIYPNPNNGLCTVQSASEGVYTVMNPLGQTVQTFRLNGTNSYTHSIDNLDNGIYFIVGDGSNGRTSKKMVVAK
jgi:hypothetical protein